MSNEMKLTKAQAAALAKLKAGGLPVITTGPNAGHLKSGVNTSVLFNLRKMGLISFSVGYLYGVVSADLKVL